MPVVVGDGQVRRRRALVRRRRRSPRGRAAVAARGTAALTAVLGDQRAPLGRERVATAGTRSGTSTNAGSAR